MANNVAPPAKSKWNVNNNTSINKSKIQKRILYGMI